MPLADVADLIVLGDGEGPVPALLALWERHGGDKTAFLSGASTVAGVFVPIHHDPREVTIVQSVSDDIGITLRADIQVNHNGQKRLEIARGCKYKCTFCSLGWRTPLRENDPGAIIDTIRTSKRIVHLQAGDAESHSGIDAIRAALRAHGGRDNGWTGRLDTLLDNPDVSADGNKKYAFGVEGISHRLRHAVGKSYLTDERLASDTVRFFTNIRDTNSRGRGAWHLIAGLPTERFEEARDLVEVIRLINQQMRGQVHRNLTLHWQPFQPLPGTPMQWCGAGGGVRRLAMVLRDAENFPNVRVRQLLGRTDEMAKICTILSRSDARGARLLEALAEGDVKAHKAAEIAGVGHGPLDPDAPLPWDFVRQHYDRDVLRRAYDVMTKRLSSQPLA